MALGSGARCAECAAGAAGYQRPLVFTLQHFGSVDLIGRHLRGTPRCEPARQRRWRTRRDWWSWAWPGRFGPIGRRSFGL